MANLEIASVNKLANEFSKLPGVGKKTALRYAYYIINLPKEGAETFAGAIMDVKDKVTFFFFFGIYTENLLSVICVA